MSKTTCAVTMVYNEGHFLPIWLAYYGRELGEENLFVIDHGSDDGSTDSLPKGVNRLRIPRSPFNDERRVKFLSEFSTSLLRWWGGLIYTDVDEFLVPDPDDYAGLSDFCDRAPHDVVTAIGFNVHQVTKDDPALIPGEPLLRQRRWVRFAYSLCKPLFTRKPIRWVPGFHFCDHPTTFDRLFNFHLNWYDLNNALQRLHRTRAMAWDNGASGEHQRWENDRYMVEFNKIERMRRVTDSDFSRSDPIVSRYVRLAEDYTAANPTVKSGLQGRLRQDCAEILFVPERFVDLLPPPR